MRTTRSKKVASHSRAESCPFSWGACAVHLNDLGRHGLSDGSRTGGLVRPHAKAVHPRGACQIKHCGTMILRALSGNLSPIDPESGNSKPPQMRTFARRRRPNTDSRRRKEPQVAEASVLVGATPAVLNGRMRRAQMVNFTQPEARKKFDSRQKLPLPFLTLSLWSLPEQRVTK